ncbi:hypothetical protein PybrP1_010414, partial [[Pythium] brassicae (nom. inval.)]
MGNPCDVQTICARCANTSGCVFDIFQARCDAAVTAEVKYCGSDDATCAGCSVSASRPVCAGTDGRCICPSLCAVVKSPRATCNGEVVNTRLWLTFGGFALLLPLLLFAQRKWNERGGVQHMRYNRRLRRQRQLRERQRDTSRDLELSTWRDHREQHKLEMQSIELKSCYWLLEDVSISTATAAGAISAPVSASEAEVPAATLSTDSFGASADVVDADPDKQSVGAECVGTDAAGGRAATSAAAKDVESADEEAKSEDVKANNDDDESGSCESEREHRRQISVVVVVNEWDR